MPDPTVRDIVQKAASGEWNIPEFQREYEWKYDQVRLLRDSLDRKLPIGMLTVWNTSIYNEPQRDPAAGRKPAWIVDGQQRITSLCILLATKPSWMDNAEWADAFKKHRLFLTVSEKGEATFGRSSSKVKVNIPLDVLIHTANSSECLRVVETRCKEVDISDSKKAEDLAVNAYQIGERTIPVVELGNDKTVKEVTDLYTRLNKQGTRLRQAQIKLATISEHKQGWVRSQFYSFLGKVKENSGWELDPAHVLQVATIYAEGKARVEDASEDMWESKIFHTWPKLKDAIDDSLPRLWEKGITDQNMIPSKYSLIPFFALHAKFRETPSYEFDQVFKWFILANLSGRYSKAPLEQLTRDSRAIHDAIATTGVRDALKGLSIKLTRTELRALLSQKFRDNSAQALLVHMLLWSSEAGDWIEGTSIPTLTKAMGKLKPQWHHIVPSAWGKKNHFNGCDKTANVTRICAETNARKLRSTPPWEYVPKYGISQEVLGQHLVPDIYAKKFTQGQLFSPREFTAFLAKRTELLVQQGASLLGIEI